MQKKILIMEDDKNVCENIKDFLSEEGFNVMTADNGIKGIEICNEWKPDMIICDIMMPSKNGYQVYEELSKIEGTKLIPFIFLTAKVEQKDIRYGMQLGVDDYLIKPFDLDDLMKTINIRLQKYSVFKTELLSKNYNNYQEKNKVFDIDDKILLHNTNNMRFIYVREIKYIKSETPYCMLKINNGKSILLRGTINNWEQKLPGKKFIRIHRTTIINTDFITKIEKLGVASYLLKLSGEYDSFVISKRYASKIKENFT